MKILADATINNISSSSSSSSCEVSISNIQEYSNFSKLPEYLYVIVDYSKEIGTASDKNDAAAEAKAVDAEAKARDAEVAYTAATTSLARAEADVSREQLRFDNQEAKIAGLQRDIEETPRKDISGRAINTERIKRKQSALEIDQKFIASIRDSLIKYRAIVDSLKSSAKIAETTKDVAKTAATKARAIADALTGDTTMENILKNYDRNLSFITNSKARKTYALDLEKYIPSDYKNFYGVYKLVANSYYVKVYQEEITGTPPQSEDLKLNVLLMYNGTSWVFYIQTQKTFKDFVYVKMFLKNDIENYITTDFYYIGQDKNVKNAGSNYKIIFTTQLPEDIIRGDLPENKDLVVGDKTIPVEYSEKRLDADTSKLITT